MSILYIEAGREYQTLLARCIALGYEDEVEAGIHRRIIRDIESLNELKKKIFREVRAKKKTSMGDLDSFTTWMLTAEASKFNIKQIVLDTASGYNMFIRQDKRRSIGRKLSWDEWDIISNDLIEIMLAMTEVDCMSIINCHLTMKMEQGPDESIAYLFPALTGRGSEEYGKMFDFVFYAEAIADKGKCEYIWHTRPSKRIKLKDRTGLLEAKIPQDYSIPLEACKTSGIVNPKFLILGPQGSGKTYSLSTLLTPKEK